MEERPVDTTLYSLNDAVPAAAERRDGERHLTLFRVGSMMIDGHRELCLIKNISAGGMIIRAYCAIEPGARLTIELKCGEPVSGVARWVEGNSVGVAFDRKVDVVDLLATSMEGPRPRMPRVEVSCVAWVRQGAETFRVQACDISQGGMKIATDRPIDIRSDVIVTLAGLPSLPGVVRWHEAGQYGITFNRVIALPELVAWLHERRERLRHAC